MDSLRDLKSIAEREGLGGAPLADYIELATETNCNLRAMLTHIEGFAVYREPEDATF